MSSAWFRRPSRPVTACLCSLHSPALLPPLSSPWCTPQTPSTGRPPARKPRFPSLLGLFLSARITSPRALLYTSVLPGSLPWCPHPHTLVPPHLSCVSSWVSPTPSCTFSSNPRCLVSAMRSQTAPSAPGGCSVSADCVKESVNKVCPHRGSGPLEPKSLDVILPWDLSSSMLMCPDVLR